MTGAFHFILWHPFYHCKKALFRLLHDWSHSSPLFLKEKLSPFGSAADGKDEKEGTQDGRLAETELNPKSSIFIKITSVNIRKKSEYLIRISKVCSHILPSEEEK